MIAVGRRQGEGRQTGIRLEEMLIKERRLCFSQTNEIFWHEKKNYEQNERYKRGAPVSCLFLA